MDQAFHVCVAWAEFVSKHHHSRQRQHLVPAPCPSQPAHLSVASAILPCVGAEAHWRRGLPLNFRLLLPSPSTLSGMQPVLVHLSKNKEGTYSFDPVSVNFMTEILKTVFAVITLLIFVSACGP